MKDPAFLPSSIYPPILPSNLSLSTNRDDHLIPIFSHELFTFKSELTSLYMHPTDYTFKLFDKNQDLMMTLTHFDDTNKKNHKNSRIQTPSVLETDLLPPPSLPSCFNPTTKTSFYQDFTQSYCTTLTTSHYQDLLLTPSLPFSQQPGTGSSRN